MTKAQAIVTAFSSSKLLLAILRTHQNLSTKSKSKALIVACLSRWGTHLGVSNSLLNLKEALRQYRSQCIVKAPLQGREQLSLDRAYLNELEDLKLIPEPITRVRKKNRKLMRLTWAM